MFQILIIALIVAVITLLYIAVEQSNTIQKYEYDLLRHKRKAKK